MRPNLPLSRREPSSSTGTTSGEALNLEAAGSFYFLPQAQVPAQCPPQGWEYTINCPVHVYFYRKDDLPGPALVVHGRIREVHHHGAGMLDRNLSNGGRVILGEDPLIVPTG